MLVIFITIWYFKNVVSTWNIEDPLGSLLNEQMTSRDTGFSNLNYTTWQFENTWPRRSEYEARIVNWSWSLNIPGGTGAGPAGRGLANRALKTSWGKMQTAARILHGVSAGLELCCGQGGFSC